MSLLAGTEQADGTIMVNYEIGMGGNKITNVKTPTNNADAATKKYVDDNDSTVLVLVKGNPTSYFVLKKHSSLNGDPTLTLKNNNYITFTLGFTDDVPEGAYKYTFDVYFDRSKDVKVYLYGDCGGTGFKSTVRYEQFDFQIFNNRLSTSIANATGGFFNRAYGSRITFSGEFRAYQKEVKLVKPSVGIGEGGGYTRFVVQNLSVIPPKPKFFGSSMIWSFEEESNNALNMASNSYFYVERVLSL